MPFHEFDLPFTIDTIPNTTTTPTVATTGTYTTTYHGQPVYTVAVDGEPVVTRTEVLNLIYQNTYKLIKALKENELLRVDISEEDIMELLREE